MPNKGRWERARCPTCSRTIACSPAYRLRGEMQRMKLRRHRCAPTSNAMWCATRFAPMSALLPYRLTEGKR